MPRAAPGSRIPLVEDLDREPARARHFSRRFRPCASPAAPWPARRRGRTQHRRRGHRLTSFAPAARPSAVRPSSTSVSASRRIALLALRSRSGDAGQQHAFGDGLAAAAARRHWRRLRARSPDATAGTRPGECRGRVTQSGDIEAGISDAYRNDNGLSVLGMTRVWPCLPSKPAAASASRSSPICRGTAPFDPTATPTAVALDGTERTTLTVTFEDSVSDGTGSIPAR